MPTVNCSPFGPKPQFELAAGTPAVGNKLFFYVGGSVNTKQTTYTDSTGSVANTNPLVLNSLGQPTTEIWFTSGQSYKVVFAPSTDTDPPTSPIWTIDNLRGINDTSVSIDQWVSGAAPTFISTTSFTLAGDQTSTYTIGRRLKLTVTAGTVYGRILTSAYAALTTITLVMDGSQVLDSGLSAVSYGLLTNDVLSIPERIATTTGTDTYIGSVGAARLVTGDEYRIKIGTANTGASTLNLDSLGAKTVKTQSGSAVGVGQLSGQHTFRYDGTDMIVLNPIDSYTLPSPSTSGNVLTSNGTIWTSAAPVQMTLGTPQNTTSGTSIDFTGIPSGIKRITINFNGVSTNGTSTVIVQIGDSGGIETSGYLSGASLQQNAGTNAYAASTAGYMLAGVNTAASVVQGSFVLTLTNSANNTWAGYGAGNDSGLSGSWHGGGAKSTSATLDRVRITTSGGADTFDAGEINIAYE